MYRKFQERRILKRMAKSGIHYIDKMDGHQFEVYLKALFRELGYFQQSQSSQMISERIWY